MTADSDGDLALSLGELESQFMRLLWQHGPSTAEQVRERLDRPLKESTVRTVLRRLEEKGLVGHRVEGRTFVFSPTAAASTVAERGARGLADRLYAGSMADLIVGLVGSSRLGAQELDRLEALIQRAREAQT
jgi:BlaI family transcriptional regulator, penicillinase repressor